MGDRLAFMINISYIKILDPEYIIFYFGNVACCLKYLDHIK